MIDSAATDHIVEEVQSRRARLWEIDDRFGVLLCPTQLVCKDEDEIGAVCKNIAIKYDGDFSVSHQIALIRVYEMLP